MSFRLFSVGDQLTACPVYSAPSSRAFGMPQNESSFKRYVGVFSSMLLFTLRMYTREYEKFTIPLTPQQADAAKDIMETCEHSEPLSYTQIHRLAYAVVSAEVIPSDTTRFTHVVEGFLVLFARHPKEDGWRKLETYAPLLAQLEWGFRLVVLFEVFLRRSEYETSTNG